MALETLVSLGSRAEELGYVGGLTCSLGVKDMGKSIEWYEGILGFKLQYRLDDMGWCELDTPVKNVSVGLSQVEEVKQGKGATLVFGVSDIDSARAKLEEKGVRFDGDTMTIPDMVRLATFFDPDGNTFMLYNSLAKS